MADLIKVNTNRLDSDVKQFENHIRAIRRQITDLKAHSRTLDSMWDGTASETFKSSFLADINSLEEILKVLDGINRYEDNARIKYDQCETKVGELVNQIHVR